MFIHICVRVSSIERENNIFTLTNKFYFTDLFFIHSFPFIYIISFSIVKTRAQILLFANFITRNIVVKPQG